MHRFSHGVWWGSVSPCPGTVLQNGSPDWHVSPCPTSWSKVGGGGGCSGRGFLLSPFALTHSGVLLHSRESSWGFCANGIRYIHLLGTSLRTPPFSRGKILWEQSTWEAVWWLPWRAAQMVRMNFCWREVCLLRLPSHTWASRANSYWSLNQSAA